MKIGILGHGSVGVRHAENARILGCEVKWHDPNINGSTSRDEVLEWADKIVVATPTAQHDSDIADNWRLGLNRPLLVEKPIVAGLRHALLHSNIKLVGYNLRFHSLVQQIKTAIDDGKIGTPIMGSFWLGQVTSRPTYLRDGVVLNWSHEIDLALHLLGPALCSGRNVHRTDGQDDIADILLTHTSGAQSVVHLDYICNPWQRHGTIVGTKGDIFYDLENGVADICGETITCPNNEFDNSYRRELSAFITDEIGPGCTAQQAIDVLKICRETLP